MKIREFTTDILYAQIMLYEFGCANPGLNWTQNHVKQGFTYSETSIAYGLPDRDQPCFVEVHTVDKFDLTPDISWAISVPFTVRTGHMIISTVMGEEFSFEIDKGKYEVIFTAKLSPDEHYSFVLNFFFLKNQNADFKIIKSCKIEGGTVSDIVLEKTATNA